MTRNEVISMLEKTGIRIEPETVVPTEGEPQELPYLIYRTEETDQGDDKGRVSIITISWRATLFSVTKDVALECKIRRALAGAGTVTVTRYPDGAPYSVDFSFTTKGVNHE